MIYLPAILPFFKIHVNQVLARDDSPAANIISMHVVGVGSITTNKASGGDGIQGELFQILKDNKFRQRFKNQRRHFANKVCLVKAMVFPVVMYGCESWAIKKADRKSTRLNSSHHA